MQRNNPIKFIQTKSNDFYVIDDMYDNRPIRVYDNYAPALRAERQGLKVCIIEKFNEFIRKGN